MHKFFYFALLLLLISSNTTFSQSFSDVIYFKDGSNTKGKIISEQGDSLIEIQKQNGAVVKFKMKDVSRIEYYSNTNDNDSSVPKIQLLTRLGILTSGREHYKNTVSNVPESIPTIGFILSQKINPNLRTGIGIEFNHYPNAAVVPIYVDVRFRFDNNHLSPYILVNAGYSLAWIKHVNGMNGDGLYLSTGVGLELTIFEDKAIILDGAYTIQSSKVVGKSRNDVTEKNDFYYNFYKFSVGFLF